MGINIKLFTVGLRRFQQNIQIGSRVGLRRKSQSHRRPTVLVANQVESLFVQVIVDVNPFRVAGVRHTVVADEDDVDDVGEVATLQSLVKVLSENVDGLQCILF